MRNFNKIFRKDVTYDNNVTKNQGFTLSIEVTFFEKPYGSQNDPTSRFKAKIRVRHACFPVNFSKLLRLRLHLNADDWKSSWLLVEDSISILMDLLMGWRNFSFKLFTEKRRKSLEFSEIFALLSMVWFSCLIIVGIAVNLLLTFKKNYCKETLHVFCWCG